MSRKSGSSDLSSRELILTLMDSTVARSLGSSYLVAAGRMFDMDPGGIRVALGRLVKDGSLKGAGRGRYALGSRAGTLQTLVRNWSRAEESLVPWSGAWLTVLIGHLTRSDKTRVRSNERALRLFGFAEAKAGLWLRPDNLQEPIHGIRSSLLQLGLDEHSVAARMTEFEPPQIIRPADLWNVPTLEARYAHHLEALARSTARLSSLDEQAAARETLLLGRQVTRDILLDPLLPDELIDGDLRRSMVAAMEEYDRLGKTIWRAIFNHHEQAGDQKPAA
jgi:phenylacetic acid degradation operon negative regulatory protein